MDLVGGEEQRLADANGEFEQTDRAGSGETAEDTIESRNTETEDATPGKLGARRSSENDEDDREMNVAAVRRAKTRAKTAFTKLGVHSLVQLPTSTRWQKSTGAPRSWTRK